LDKQEKIERFFVETQDSMKRTQQVFDSVWGNLGSAIDNFVKTGKLNMKDFARSVIQDLIAIQMKAAAMKFLGAMFGMSNPMTMTQTDFVSASGGRMFADGGDPPVGMASLVGERGPELFVPRTAGTIIPNHDLGKMGGTTTVINNNINAIDAKSFENRLLESSNTIWAGYQYANKQLASNGRRA
jgi:phage-related minor tail protein